jgi:hypothetical protein
MIIYGSKAVHLKAIQPKALTCPSCNTQGSTVVSVFRRHAHIFWIPLFPIGKKGFSQCQHCKHVIEPKEMPESFRREYEFLKDDSKGPAWQFVGLGIIAVLIALIAYTSGENAKQELAYIETPQEGDVYEYKIENGSYSTLKVIGTSKDSVFVTPNDYVINKMSQLHKIDKAENYADFSYGVSKNRLKEMYDSGEIFDINRR